MTLWLIFLVDFSLFCAGKDLSLMMQALNTLQSPEEKIAALCKKYADLLDQQKLLQKQLRMSQRKQVLNTNLCILIQRV